MDDGIVKNNTRWVNGNVIENPCSGPPQNYVDDIKFLKTLVKLLIDTLPINTSKVFASGFSNGSAMIHKMANDAGDVFAAVAGSSAPLTLTDSVQPVKRIPVWFIVGTSDDRFIMSPFTELPFGGDSILDYLASYLNRALGCQGLTQAYTKSETPSTHTYIFNENRPGEKSKPYYFTLIKDMTHEYPNGINHPFNAPVQFWQFFNQSTMVATNSEVNNKEDFEIYPNPSHDIIHVSLTYHNPISTYRIKILNAYGQSVYQNNHLIKTDLIFGKDQLGPGMFIIQLESGAGIISKKVLIH